MRLEDMIEFLTERAAQELERDQGDDDPADQGPEGRFRNPAHEKEADDDPGQRRRQEGPKNLPDDDATIDHDGADIAHDQQGQDKAGRFPRLEDDGEEQDRQNAETGEAALIQPDAECATGHGEPAQAGEMKWWQGEHQEKLEILAKKEIAKFSPILELNAKVAMGRVAFP